MSITWIATPKQAFRAAMLFITLMLIPFGQVRLIPLVLAILFGCELADFIFAKLQVPKHVMILGSGVSPIEFRKGGAYMLVGSCALIWLIYLGLNRIANSQTVEVVGLLFCVAYSYQSIGKLLRR